ncbi:MAG TPA: glycosyltransferase, partial [Candidatus Dormibacteraeota bacterium]|nr:glycosyltransferase [Candidatus Dormibacteraeota bacterium]
ILEAMAMKVAVVASNVGAVSDVIDSGKNGLVVTPGSVREIVVAIEKLRDNPKLMNYIKDNARDTVTNKYSNEILGDNYEQMYRNLLK